MNRQTTAAVAEEAGQSGSGWFQFWRRQQLGGGGGFSGGGGSFGGGGQAVEAGSFKMKLGR